MYLTGNSGFFPAGYEQIFYYEPTQSLQVSVGSVLKLINNKQISRTDIDILSFLFEFNMASLEQIQLLFSDSDDINKIKGHLDRLVQYRLLNKFCLGDGEKQYNDKAYLIYCIDKGGADLLFHLKDGEDYTGFRIERIIQPALRIWKHIIAVDFYIRLLQSCPNKLQVYRVMPTIPFGKLRIIPHFSIAINHNNNTKYFVGDIVFSSDVSALATRSESFTEKAIQLETLVSTNLYKKCFGVDNPPTLLIIAEDEETMGRVAQIISTTDIGKYTQYRITTPELLNQPLGDRGVFYSFKNEKLISAPNGVFVE